ncbi:1485_t:CDS:2 [Dentiscutata erythropus]|uniref:1485_t:CDS:1 n=1 Tax=Dentiscutata erythropus TaxID=1348616 RepID=A0A9N9BRA7_9GLOM|nr:1485_t:CDS:2 [Dentiscutata erythropus]
MKPQNQTLSASNTQNSIKATNENSVKTNTSMKSIPTTSLSYDDTNDVFKLQ